MEGGEEIRYGIEEAVVRLLAWSICTFTALIQLLSFSASNSEVVAQIIIAKLLQCLRINCYTGTTLSCMADRGYNAHT